MASKSKKRRARMASQRVNLTFEHLEARHLFSVSSSALPMLEPMETSQQLTSNFMPMVYAGADMTVSIADGAVINGEVIANIPSNLSVAWSLVSGPGSAAFSNPGFPSTTVTFSQAGTYELELTAVNGGAIASDRVIVSVLPRTPPSTLALSEGIALYLGDERQFTGNNDHDVIVHDGNYLLDEGTVAFWFKADDTTIKQGLFSKDSNGYDTGGHLSFILQSDGRVSVRLQSTSSSYTLYANSSIQPDSWYHVALNFGPGGMELFLDGALQQSDAYTGGLGTSSGGIGNQEPIVLGADSGTSGNLQATPVELPLLGGAIDEVVIVDYALSPEELATLITGEAAGPAAPIANDSSLTTGEDVTINAAVTATDANGDPLTFKLVDSTSNGILSFNTDGTYTYTPNGSFVGNDSFTFQANDGSADSNIATVAITVQEISDVEVLAANNPLTVTEGATGTITAALLTTTDTDNTPAELIYTITSGASNGAILRSGSATTSFTQADIDSGLITYQHNGNETTSDSFGFTVNDAQGPGTSGTFNVNVTLVNDEQVLATNNTMPVSEGTTATITSAFLATTDNDNTPAELIYTITSGTSNGTVLLSGSATTTLTQADVNAGLVTYQHNGSQTTSDNFNFTVDDGQGTSTSGTFSVNVTQANGSQPILPELFDTTYSLPTGGTTLYVNAGDDFQAALDAAVAGDVIVLEAGATFTGNFRLENKVGNDWIYIISSKLDQLPIDERVGLGDAANMPKLVAQNSQLPVLISMYGAHNYRIAGIEVSTDVAMGDLIRTGWGLDPGETSLWNIRVADTIAELPHHITFDRMLIHSTSNSEKLRVGIGLNGQYMAVINSYIANVKDGPDAQAILSWNGAGPYKIVNNFLEATGENVMFGGTDPQIPNLLPSDIEIRGNYFFKRTDWISPDTWNVKNLLELKNAQRLLISGNVFENNWSDAQKGYAIVFTPRNQNGTAPWSVVQDVTFENNLIKNTAKGFLISGEDYNNPSQQTKRIRISNNILENVSYNYSNKPQLLHINTPEIAGDGGVGQPVLDLTITHNTFLYAFGEPPGNRWVYLEANGSAQAVENLVFKDNITAHGDYGFSYSEAINTTLSDNVILFDPAERTYSNYINNFDSIYPGNSKADAIDDVGFVDYANGDYRLAAGSPHKNTASDGTDPGANIDTLNQAINGVAAGSLGLQAQGLAADFDSTAAVSLASASIDSSHSIMNVSLASSVWETTSSLTREESTDLYLNDFAIPSSPLSSGATSSYETSLADLDVDEGSEDSEAALDDIFASLEEDGGNLNFGRIASLAL